MVGSDWSTSNRVETLSVDRVTVALEAGNVPGIGGLEGPALELKSGTTAPRRWPDPEKTFVPFGGI